MTTLQALHQQWLTDPAYKEAYDELEKEVSLAEAIADARQRAGQTQEASR